MNFLAPLFLLGALAIGLPILFHLIRRTTRDRMPFSSLMFLSATPPRVTRRSRLENVFLLLLRCGVLCLLALGFARPFFQKPGEAAPNSEDPKKFIFLIDTSASMRREDLWAAARAKAEEWLAKVSPTDQVAVFTFDRAVRRLVTFEQWLGMNPGERVALAGQRLAQTPPGWSATYLGNALIAAAEAFDESADKKESFGSKQIILITDLQVGSRLDGLQGYEWPRGLELIVEPLQARRPTNGGLQIVLDREESVQSTNAPDIRLRVTNAADSKREQFQVRWEGVADSSPVEAYVPPGQNRIVAAPKAGSTNSNPDRLVLAGDENDFDNTVYFIQPTTEHVRILYLGNESATNHTEPLYYLHRAFQQTRRRAVQILPRRVDAVVPGAELADATLMIITDALPEGQVSAVQEFLKRGKTVLLAMKSAAAAPTVAHLANREHLAAEEASIERYAMLGEIQFEHPLFAPFADPRYSDFTKIHFWKHRRIDASPLPDARILARFDTGDAALVEIPINQGSLLVLTSGWNPADSQLALSSKFVPLLYSMLEQSNGLQGQRVQYWVGDEVSLSSTNSAASLAIRKPDGSQVDVPKETKFSQTDWPGIYTVASSQPLFRFAVNLDPAESKTAQLPIEELERLGLPMKKDAPKQTAKEFERKRQLLLAAELENQQKLWRWLIVAALIFLVLETWLAGWLTRRAAARAEV